MIAPWRLNLYTKWKNYFSMKIIIISACEKATTKTSGIFVAAIVVTSLALSAADTDDEPKFEKNHWFSEARRHAHNYRTFHYSQKLHNELQDAVPL